MAWLLARRFASFASLLRRQQVDEVLRRRGEQGDEVLKRRLERREEHRPKLVLSGHRRELVLDTLRVENGAFDETRLDLELLARRVLAKRLHDLRGRARVLVAPGDSG